jgi:hypothetical protein
MAHFYGSLKGDSRGEATRCGTKSSGICTHIRGWDVGVQVNLEENAVGTEAIIAITGGSNHHRRSVSLEITPKGLEAILDGRAELKVVKTGS